jgi:hypothetical protein
MDSDVCVGKNPIISLGHVLQSSESAVTYVERSGRSAGPWENQLLAPRADQVCLRVADALILEELRWVNLLPAAIGS